MRQSKKIKKSLRYSILDGSFWAIMFGFGERYLAAFAVFLKATNMQLGLLTSLPLLLASTSEFFSTKLIDFFKSRKKFVVISVLIQTFTWIPILLVFYFGKLSVYFLIFFAIIYWVSGMIAVPAWSSWIGDLVDPKERGKYFGRRNKIIGAVTFVAIVLGGLVLDFFRGGITKQYFGFVAIFSIALIGRLISAFFLNKKYEPKLVVPKDEEGGFFQFLKQLKYKNFGLLVLFLSFMNFAGFVAFPYFVAYMLNDLKFTYFTYMVIIAVGFITKYLSLPVWGRLSDAYGTKKIMTLTGYMMPALPMLWLISKSVYFLIAVQLVAGCVWAGFELSTFNFLFDTTTPEKRAKYIAYFNVINGVMIFLGATAGSLIIKYNQVFWTQYYLVFLVSGILRYAVSFTFLPRLKEVREVDDISYEKILFKAMVGITHTRSLLSLPKRIMKRK
jgi:MFS family permease